MAGKTRGAGARRRRTARRAQQLQHARRPADAALVAAVSGGTGLPLGPREAKWDATAADEDVRTWAGAKDAPNAKYASAFFYKGGDGTKFGDYKLGFAEPEGGTLTANWGGITAVAGVLSGARGGVKGLTPAEVSGVKSRVASYYSKAKTKYKDDSIKVPWVAKSEASIAFGEERGLDVFLDGAGGFAGMGGDFDPVELVAAQNQAAARALALAVYGLDADPAILAVATAMWIGAFAPMPACAECDHAYTAHLGEEGPCTVDGCSCDGYTADDEAPETGSSTTPAATATVKFKLQPMISDLVHEELSAQYAARESALEAILLDGVPEPVAETIRLRLQDFRLGRFDPAGVRLPDEHLPGGVLPAAEPSSEPVPPTTNAAGEVEWNAILCPEGKLTSDGRGFAPGAVTWREVPLTLMAMIETSEGGHIGAQVAGRIDRIWRDQEAGLIRASGVFDDGEYGQKIEGLVTDRTLRGVSVDLAIHDYKIGPRSNWFDENGDWAPADEEAPPPSPYEGDPEPTVALVTNAEIGMTTVCPFPAFAGARIAVGDSIVAGSNPGYWTVTNDAMFATRPTGPIVAAAETPCGCGCHDDGALTAAAAGIAPVAPPAAWFEKPELEKPTALTSTDEGQVYGYAALWGTCHIGLPGCVTAPHTTTDYRFFHLGEIELEDGTRVACGQITIDAPHAGLTLNGPEATAHYDQTGCVVAHVRVGEDEHGIWVAGAIHPEASAEKVRLLRGAKLSGDWRKFPDAGRELVALLAVNVPGFPVPRAEEGKNALVAAGIVHDLPPEVIAPFDAILATLDIEALGRSI